VAAAGSELIEIHLNQVIREFDLNMFYVAGPAQGGPAVTGHTYLEGTCREACPEVG
jgi:xylulose-5-phosphate/fructose-6-phosphate phosphoketolase